MARQNLIGIVINQGKLNKTVKVRVQGREFDKRVGKEVLKRKDFLVHDEKNLCREGDLVRIESTPKISTRKRFAVAEIKSNWGHQVQSFELMAKKRLATDAKQHKQEEKKVSENLSKILTQLQDFKSMDRLAWMAVNKGDEKKANLIKEMNAISKKYKITSWPTTTPLKNLDLQKPKFANEKEKRLFYIDRILDEVMRHSEHKDWRNSIISQRTKQELSAVPMRTKKNILRKYILNVKNTCPVSLP
ncbi:37S ribosomal protein S17, mitochondrial [Candida viswanathii]|uniref:37S ribosomal protein S17, mitochondrial n=1 Tax=Candida viswanathii TaxID=5486 RepID=A0A367Y334_9ASCO|nr:37S ribosomal protein S17, mitochondrial [Candida viswanathii]